MIDTDEAEARALRLQLVDELTAKGALTSPDWRAAFASVPRHRFVPAFYRYGAGGLERWDSDSPSWLRAVYQDEALATQLTDGVPTSSSTLPSLMARMLQALDVVDGMRVLEIGTGTGYNAALLAQRAEVVTVDVDPALTGPAEQRLKMLGYRATVVTGDGADGHPAGAPFDRIITTCSVRSIPPAWLEQLAEGGNVLATLVTGLHGYALALVDADGHGRILNIPASFMLMRSHSDPAFVTLRAQAGPTVMEGTTEEPVVGDDERFVLGLALPDVVVFGLPDRKTPGLYLAHRTDGSWAHVLADGRVAQGGPQRPWDQLQEAREAWREAGAPAPAAFEVSVAGKQQRLQHGDLVYELPGFVWP